MSSYNTEIHAFWDSSTSNSKIVDYPLNFKDLRNPRAFRILDYSLYGADSTKLYYWLQLRFNKENAFVRNQDGIEDGLIQLQVVSNNYVARPMQPILVKDNMNHDLTITKITATLLNPDKTPATISVGMHLRLQMVAHEVQFANVEGRRPVVLDMNND